MGDVGDGERKNEEERKEKQRRREATDEPEAHGSEQPFQFQVISQHGAGGNNPQVQGPIIAGTESILNFGTQEGSNPLHVKGSISADTKYNFGNQVFSAGNFNSGTQYYHGTSLPPATELFGGVNFNVGDQLYHGYFPRGPYGLYNGTITHLNGVTVIRPYGDSEDSEDSIEPKKTL